MPGARAKACPSAGTPRRRRRYAGAAVGPHSGGPNPPARGRRREAEGNDMARAAPLTFRFDGRASPVRRWDIRFRIAAAAVLSAALLSSPAWSLLPLGVLLTGLLAFAKATPREVLRVLRGFSGFLLFFVGLGVLFEPTWPNTV